MSLAEPEAEYVRIPHTLQFGRQGLARAFDDKADNGWPESMLDLAERVFKTCQFTVLSPHWVTNGYVQVGIFTHWHAAWSLNYALDFPGRDVKVRRGQLPPPYIWATPRTRCGNILRQLDVEKAGARHLWVQRWGNKSKLSHQQQGVWVFWNVYQFDHHKLRPEDEQKGEVPKDVPGSGSGDWTLGDLAILWLRKEGYTVGDAFDEVKEEGEEDEVVSPEVSPGEEEEREEGPGTKKRGLPVKQEPGTKGESGENKKKKKPTARKVVKQKIASEGHPSNLQRQLDKVNAQLEKERETAKSAASSAASREAAAKKAVRAAKQRRLAEQQEAREAEEERVAEAVAAATEAATEAARVAMEAAARAAEAGTQRGAGAGAAEPPPKRPPHQYGLRARPKPPHEAKQSGGDEPDQLSEDESDRKVCGCGRPQIGALTPALAKLTKRGDTANPIPAYCLFCRGAVVFHGQRRFICTCDPAKRTLVGDGMAHLICGECGEMLTPKGLEQIATARAKVQSELGHRAVKQEPGVPAVSGLGHTHPPTPPRAPPPAHHHQPPASPSRSLPKCICTAQGPRIKEWSCLEAGTQPGQTGAPLCTRCGNAAVAKYTRERVPVCNCDPPTLELNRAGECEQDWQCQKCNGLLSHHRKMTLLAEYDKARAAKAAKAAQPSRAPGLGVGGFGVVCFHGGSFGVSGAKPSV